MMRQYQDAKNACPDALLLFRMGDFYELFFDDARTAARLLGLALTSRDKGENAVPMAGFPHHQLESYLAKLVSLGTRVAICEQVEDPRQAKGLVKREVTRVVTPGTLTDDALLDPREANYLAAVVSSTAGRASSGTRNGQADGKLHQDDLVGLAWVELSIGRFQAAVVPRSKLADQLARIAPSECLVEEESELPLRDTCAAHDSGSGQEQILLTRRPAWAFALPTALQTLEKQFGTATLDGFGFDAERDALALRRRRDSRLSNGNPTRIAGASRSVAALSHWHDAGN